LVLLAWECTEHSRGESILTVMVWRALSTEAIVPSEAISSLGQSILKFLKMIRSELPIVTQATTGEAKLRVEP